MNADILKPGSDVFYLRGTTGEHMPAPVVGLSSFARCLTISHRGSISMPGTRWAFFFTHSPPLPVFAPPPPLTKQYGEPSRHVSPWQGWWVEVVGVTFCVVEFSYFGLCNVLCIEGLQSCAAYLGHFPRWG